MRRRENVRLAASLAAFIAGCALLLIGAYLGLALMYAAA